MINKLLSTTLVGVFAACIGGVSVHAADVASSGCGVAGLVQGGGMLDRQTWSFGGPSRDLAWTSAFGEAALAYNCENWGGQIDGAAYGFWSSTGTKAGNANMGQGHIGGELYWRDPTVGALGIAGSRIFQSYSDSLANNNKSTGLWRVGGFGEYYAGDMLTLGAGAYYLNGGSLLTPTPTNQRGFEGDVYAKLYASNNLSFLLRGDVLSSGIYNPDGSEFSGYSGAAVTGQAEYLIPDTALSLFAGGRYSNRSVFTQNSDNLVETQGFIGASFAFGGPTPSSLRDRDRHGTFDNTSVFQEKLLNPYSETPFE